MVQAPLWRELPAFSLAVWRQHVTEQYEKEREWGCKAAGTNQVRRISIQRMLVTAAWPVGLERNGPAKKFVRMLKLLWSFNVLRLWSKLTVEYAHKWGVSQKCGTLRQPLWWQLLGHPQTKGVARGLEPGMLGSSDHAALGSLRKEIPGKTGRLHSSLDTRWAVQGSTCWSPSSSEDWGRRITWTQKF